MLPAALGSRRPSALSPIPGLEGFERSHRLRPSARSGSRAAPPTVSDPAYEGGGEGASISSQSILASTDCFSRCPTNFRKKNRLRLSPPFFLRRPRRVSPPPRIGAGRLGWRRHRSPASCHWHPISHLSKIQRCTCQRSSQLQNPELPAPMLRLRHARSLVLQRRRCALTFQLHPRPLEPFSSGARGPCSLPPARPVAHAAVIPQPGAARASSGCHERRRYRRETPGPRSCAVCCHLLACSARLQTAGALLRGHPSWSLGHPDSLSFGLPLRCPLAAPRVASF